MKKVFLSLPVMAAVILSSCNSNGSTDQRDTGPDSSQNSMQTGDTSDRMDHNHEATTATATPDSMNNPQGGAKPGTDVADFVSKALSGGMMEVQLGNLAAQKAQDARVKNFGQMMVTDHTKAGDELKAMAQKDNLPVPAGLLPQHQAHINMMKGKSGAAFDRAYMDMMVNDHNKDIAEYKKATSTLTSDPYKLFATKTLPLLQMHLDSAKAIAKAKR